MQQVVETVGRRVDLAPISVVVALGDVALIALFVVVGEINHGTPPWEFPMRALETFLPFLAGWIVTAFVGGLYTRDAWQFPLRAVSWTTPAWLATVGIAMVIRSTPVVHGGVQLTFVVVSIVVGLALLLPWRTVIAVLDSD